MRSVLLYSSQTYLKFAYPLLMPRGKECIQDGDRESRPSIAPAASDDPPFPGAGRHYFGARLGAPKGVSASIHRILQNRQDGVSRGGFQ
jgi:hypothetical protein